MMAIAAVSFPFGNAAMMIIVAAMTIIPHRSDKRDNKGKRGGSATRILLQGKD
jgi:hypothetical protein